MLSPRSHLRLEGCCVVDLPSEDTNLDFGLAQPTSILGNVVGFESVKIRVGFIKRDEPVGSGGIVRAELIDHAVHSTVHLFSVSST